jgi:hypothetical protein
LRNAIIDALGKSNSEYALKSLLEYAKYSDDERLLARIAEALAEWDVKLDDKNMQIKDKERMKARMTEIMTREQKGSHYG